MENFFYEDEFCSDIEALMSHLDLEDEDLQSLPDDWKVKVILCELEKIFEADEDFVITAIMNRTDKFEERFPEDSDDIAKKIEEAIKQSIDIDKLNSLLPELYYPSDKTETITKEYLIDYCK